MLLDYDGTLAPFRVDRFQALPWAGVRDLLNQIQNQGRTRIVVVTGRPAAEILPLLGVEPAPEVWGLHGAERLHPDGRRELEQLSPEIRAKLDALAAQLRRDATGGLIEEKPNAIVMHWRGVPPARARIIEKRTRALSSSLLRRWTALACSNSKPASSCAQAATKAQPSRRFSKKPLAQTRIAIRIAPRTLLLFSATT